MCQMSGVSTADQLFSHGFTPVAPQVLDTLMNRLDETLEVVLSRGNSLTLDNKVSEHLSKQSVFIGFFFTSFSSFPDLTSWFFFWLCPSVLLCLKVHPSFFDGSSSNSSSSLIYCFYSSSSGSSSLLWSSACYLMFVHCFIYGALHSLFLMVYDLSFDSSTVFDSFLFIFWRLFIYHSVVPLLFSHDWLISVLMFLMWLFFASGFL